MDFRIYGVSKLVFLSSCLLLVAAMCVALPESSKPRLSSPSSGSGQINSNSVIVALLDSHYTELAELVEKALLIQTLEETVGKHNITVFTPKNEALERDLDPEFKWFFAPKERGFHVGS